MAECKFTIAQHHGFKLLLSAQWVFFYLLNVAVLDIFDPRKGLLNALPVNDILPINILDGDFLDVCRSSQAKGLGFFHYCVGMTVRE